MRAIATRISTRAAALCLAVLLACGLFAGCSRTNPQSVLYRRGMSIIYTMCDMAESDYIELQYGSSLAAPLDTVYENGMTFREQMKGEYYKTADAVFRIEATVDMSDSATDGLSEELLERYEITSAIIIPSYMTVGIDGASKQARIAIVTASELFTCEGLRENTVFHYLYVFQEGLPVIVTYHVGRDGAVQATGKFMINKELNLTSEEEMKDYIARNCSALRNVTVEQVR